MYVFKFLVFKLDFQHMTRKRFNFQLYELKKKKRSTHATRVLKLTTPWQFDVVPQRRPHKEKLFKSKTVFRCLEMKDGLETIHANRSFNFRLLNRYVS